MGVTLTPTRQKKLDCGNYTHTVRKTEHQLKWDRRNTAKKLLEQQERKVKRDKEQRASAKIKHESMRRVELELLGGSWVATDRCGLHARHRIDEMIVAAPPYYGNSPSYGDRATSDAIKECAGMVFDWERKQWFATDRSVLRRMLSLGVAWVPEPLADLDECQWARKQLQRLVDVETAKAASAAGCDVSTEKRQATLLRSELCVPPDTECELATLRKMGFALKNLDASAADGTLGPRAGISRAARAIRYICLQQHAVAIALRHLPLMAADLKQAEARLSRVMSQQYTPL